MTQLQVHRGLESTGAAVQELGSSLPESSRIELMSLIEAPKAEGRNFEDVKSVVDIKLEERGIEIPLSPGSLVYEIV